MKSKFINQGKIKIAKPLYDLVNDEIIPGTGIDPDNFWISLSKIITDLGPENIKLLHKRTQIQNQIDNWHKNNKNFDVKKYKSFLKKIGYIEPKSPQFKISTKNIDDEVSNIPGPQLVVPIDNARFAINAANARWWSLYDSLYGTDILQEEKNSKKTYPYNPHRGAQVVSYSTILLDKIFPIKDASYSHVSNFSLKKNNSKFHLEITLTDKRVTQLGDSTQFIGFNQDSKKNITSILLKNNDLHVEIQIDRKHPIGIQHPAGIKDILLESAITTIQDFEDSVAAVDVDDKVKAYRNWTELMKGTCTAELTKNGETIRRSLNPDKNFTSDKGNKIILHGRSLLLVRNVGMHMYTDSIQTISGENIPEGFMDAMITSLSAIHDIKNKNKLPNSRKKSIYIVKPKMHGPKEVSLTVKLFSLVEKALDLPKNTIKIGIMDEERRTTVNLKQCIYEARERIIFINTGFLDRTGDEIHTSMEAGPVLPKDEIKEQDWLEAYENQNVDIGIECGLIGKAQIGKGMWAMPDEMNSMMQTKVSHTKSGANTAWVPSPTAAALHSIHYHLIKVKKVQKNISSRRQINFSKLICPPLLNRKLNKKEIVQELENNAQGILGYVSRWVGQGIGCSKIPNISNIGLMEDRATLRISSQHIVNWLYHKITNPQEVTRIFKKMAKIVDDQNSTDENYTPMSQDFNQSIEFKAALDLVFKGRDTTNGYTEPILHSKRSYIKNN